MDTSKKEIYLTLQNILADKELLTLIEIDEKYLEFRTKFPKLFDMVMSCISQQEFLREIILLLNIREDVLTGRQTDIQANIKIGERAAEKYIYPKVGKPTQQQKKTALAKILAQHTKDMNNTE